MKTNYKNKYSARLKQLEDDKMAAIWSGNHQLAGQITREIKAVMMAAKRDKKR